MGHDKDSDQELDPEEFANAISNYAEVVGTDLHELIDFMCVVSLQADSSDYETAFARSTTTGGQKRASTFKPGLGTIIDFLEGSDEEEEDDW